MNNTNYLNSLYANKILDDHSIKFDTSQGDSHNNTLNGRIFSDLINSVKLPEDTTKANLCYEVFQDIPYQNPEDISFNIISKNDPSILSNLEESNSDIQFDDDFFESFSIDGNELDEILEEESLFLKQKIEAEQEIEKANQEIEKANQEIDITNQEIKKAK